MSRWDLGHAGNNCISHFVFFPIFSLSSRVFYLLSDVFLWSDTLTWMWSQLYVTNPQCFTLILHVPSGKYIVIPATPHPPPPTPFFFVLSLAVCGLVFYLLHTFWPDDDWRMHFLFRSPLLSLTSLSLLCCFSASFASSFSFLPPDWL